MRIPFLTQWLRRPAHQTAPDIEKHAANANLSTPTPYDSKSPNTHLSSANTASPHTNPAGSPPDLLKFQTLTGIVSPTPLLPHPIHTHPTLTSRPAPNEGIYKRTVDEERTIKFRYQFSNYLVNTCYMLQIIVGAALTALGAASGPSAAVTILGALNTIVAGALTYLKGQGLPMRLEQYLHQLRALREHIEEREREFMQPGGCGRDVEEEIEGVWRMYQEVRQTAQDNAPGTVLPPRGMITGLLKKPDIERKDVMRPRGDRAPRDVWREGIGDLEEVFRRGGGGLGEAGETLRREAGEAARREAGGLGREVEKVVREEARGVGKEVEELRDVVEGVVGDGRKTVES